jgi:hypothetical protein
MVSCSHKFVSINLKNDMNHLDLSAETIDYGASEADNPTSITMTIVDAYGKQNDKDMWLPPRAVDDATKLFDKALGNVSLQKFALVFRFGGRRKVKNKVLSYQKGKPIVPIFSQSTVALPWFATSRGKVIVRARHTGERTLRTIMSSRRGRTS